MNRISRSLCRGLLLLAFFFSFSAVRPARSAGVWGRQPLISYFALAPSLEVRMRVEAGLSEREFWWIEKIAQEEAARLQTLRELSNRLISHPALSLSQKRQIITNMGYNRRVAAIVYETGRNLQSSLSATAFRRLVSWIERRWPLEQALHGSPAARPDASGLAAPRGYEVFATRYESKGGAYTVALPDQCLKLANGGLHTCDDKGYQPGVGYSLAISYKKGIGVGVGEAGPWNIDDNFWATSSDPQPRRMFADLAVGMPEAQAAYFNGYNGGLDQYGRKVTAPFAIDLAFKVADDIGLPAKKNDWITVSFLWTEGWGSKAQNPLNQPGTTPGAPQATSNFIPQVEMVTPAADGSIVHVVQAGETLWAIAVAYRINIAQVQFLNNMGQTVVIYEGQRLVIKEAGPTWTPVAGTPGLETPSGVPDQTLTPAGSTPTIPATTPLPRTPSATVTRAPASRTATSEALDTRPAPTSGEEIRRESSERGGAWLSERNLLIGGLAIAGLGALMLILGWLFNRRAG